MNVRARIYPSTVLDRDEAGKHRAGVSVFGCKLCVCVRVFVLRIKNSHPIYPNRHSTTTFSVNRNTLLLKLQVCVGLNVQSSIAVCCHSMCRAGSSLTQGGLLHTPALHPGVHPHPETPTFPCPPCRQTCFSRSSSRMVQRFRVQRGPAVSSINKHPRGEGTCRRIYYISTVQRVGPGYYPMAALCVGWPALALVVLR